MTGQQYDRSAQDLGNIVNLGHVNVCITDQHLATHYYISGLGLTRDPFLNTGARNMWVNVGLLTREVNEHEYRFQDIIDLDTREVLFKFEHEVRSQTHPLYGRPLINRNPAQTNAGYSPGHDSISWAMG
jgi:hypothetical protein